MKVGWREQYVRRRRVRACRGSSAAGGDLGWRAAAGGDGGGGGAGLPREARGKEKSVVVREKDGREWMLADGARGESCE